MAFNLVLGKEQNQRKERYQDEIILLRPEVMKKDSIFIGSAQGGGGGRESGGERLSGYAIEAWRENDSKGR